MTPAVDSLPESMRQFAQQITPSSWNVVLHPGQNRWIANTLNLLLSVKSGPFEVFTDSEGRLCGPDIPGAVPCPAMLRGNLLYTPLDEMRIDLPGTAAHGVIQIWPRAGDWKELIIEALAQTAVCRYLAFQARIHRTEFTTAFSRPNIAPGDPLHRKAKQLFQKRADDRSDS